MKNIKSIQEVEFYQLKKINGGSTTTCTKTETTRCNSRGTRCTTVSVEVCVKKP